MPEFDFTPTVWAAPVSDGCNVGACRDDSDAVFPLSYGVRTGDAPEDYTDVLTMLAFTPRSLTEIEKAGTEVAAVVHENRGQITSILDGLNETSTNLSTLTADVKRRPWRLLYRPSVSELKAMLGTGCLES